MMGIEVSFLDLPHEVLARVALYVGSLCLSVSKQVHTLKEHIVNAALNESWEFIRYAGGNRSLVRKAAPFCMLLCFREAGKLVAQIAPRHPSFPVAQLAPRRSPSPATP